jgi:hypothetical protein
MIPLRVHNILDYVIGAFMIIAPWLFRFSTVPVVRNLFLVLGVGIVVYSLLTNYYFSVFRVIPLGVHMTLDTLVGIVLILAPALFGYRDLITEGQYALHIILGIGAVGLVALTRPRTEAAKTPAERAAISHDLPVHHH